MRETSIKNYDVFVVRVAQVLLSALAALTLSYAVIMLLVLFFDKEFINLWEFIEHIMLFDDAKPIALFISWGVTIVVALVLIKVSLRNDIKTSVLMKKWIAFKLWASSLREDYDSK